jgi:ribosome-associated protein
MPARSAGRLRGTDPEAATDEAVATPPSKSQRKRDAHDLQELGEALAALSAERVRSLPMPESLRDAVLEFQHTRSHEGRRRQMQYIGRLMRSSPIEPIREAVLEARLGRAQDALALHRLERWREELLAADEAIDRWAVEHPASDLQHLRSLVRSARRDLAPVVDRHGTVVARPADAGARKGRAYRELFRFIKQHLEAAP